MGLGLQTSNGSGSFKSFVKYDARAGRFFRNDRTQDASGQFSSTDVDITQTASFVADLANIRVGWVSYTAQGPMKRFVTLGQPLPARPEDKGADGKPAFKQGFELDIKLHNSCGGGPVRDFGSAAGCVIEAIDALHDAYTAAPEAKAGKLPVVKITTTLPVKSGQSTNYKPVFEIAGWVDRPADMAGDFGHSNSHSDQNQFQSDAPMKAPAPPVTGSTVAAPPPSAAPAPVADLSDFG